MLSIRTTHPEATDLGFLLHKNPWRVHEAQFSFGSATVFFPEVSDSATTAVIAVEVNPIDLVRARDGAQLADEYVNDRPYSASSLLSSVMLEFFSTAMGGRCKERPELAQEELPFEVEIPVIQSDHGSALVHKLFEPLGYEVVCVPLSEDYPGLAGRKASHYKVTLRGKVLLKDLLTALYVLIPVIDSEKHYRVQQGEIDQLLRRGGTWLAQHPEREFITGRFLKSHRRFTKDALARLNALSQVAADEDTEPEEEKLTPVRVSLHRQRLESALDALKHSGARRVLDIGCGEGKLLKMLLQESQFSQIIGLDISYRALERAKRVLGVETMSDRQRERISLMHGSITYRNRALEGFDAAVLVEVIEHVDEERLEALETVLFQHCRPHTVIITTPNREYNAQFESMEAGTFRHTDHRFEWSRAEFAAWVSRVQETFGYGAQIHGVGAESPSSGHPSQMVVMTRR